MRFPQRKFDQAVRRSESVVQGPGVLATNGMFQTGTTPHAAGGIEMEWVMSKRHVKMFCAVALATICGAAMASSDTEQFQRFKDPNQWGAPAGNLSLTRYSTLKDINTGNVKDLQMQWSQSSGT
jgi:glucose dehydrogenase